MNEDIKVDDIHTLRSFLKKDIDFQTLRSLLKHHVTILIFLTGIIFAFNYSLKMDIRDNKAELKAEIHANKAEFQRGFNQLETALTKIQK